MSGLSEPSGTTDKGGLRARGTGGEAIRALNGRRGLTPSAGVC